MPTDPQQVWEQSLPVLRGLIGEQFFNIWVQPARYHSWRADDSTLVLSVPSAFYRDWLAQKYSSVISDTLTRQAGHDVRLEVIVDARMAMSGAGVGSTTGLAGAGGRTTPQPVAGAHAVHGSAYGGNGGAGAPHAHAFAVAGTEGDGLGAAPPLSLETSSFRGAQPTEFDPEVASLFATTRDFLPRYTFDSFVVGESNRYAFKAAEVVAQRDSRNYNPLFIYGKTGLGKTHLLQAIGHRFLQFSNRVAYVTFERFTNFFIEAIGKRRQLEFRSFFRCCDLLLIDDIQFIEGKEQTQMEFFHTFNALYESGRKIVIASDRPISRIEKLEDRLRSRFEWGMIVDIHQPDLETRMAILDQRARELGCDVPLDVRWMVAEHATDHIRQLEGTLDRIVNFAKFHKRPIDLTLARQAIRQAEGNEPETETRIKVDDVIDAVCDYFSITRKDLLGESRVRKHCEPRHIAMFLSRKLTTLSLPDLGQRFNGRDHSSILHACKRIEGNLTKDANLAMLMTYLTRQLQEGRRPGGGARGTGPHRP